MNNVANDHFKYLLSPYFRIVGFVFIIVSIIVLILSAMIKSYFYILPDAQLILMYNRLSFLAGLSFIIFSGEKVESDETRKARYNALILSLAVSAVLLFVIEVVNVFNNNAPVNAVDFMIIEMCNYYIFFRLRI